MWPHIKTCAGMTDVNIKVVVKSRQGSQGNGTRRGIWKISNASLRFSLIKTTTKHTGETLVLVKLGGTYMVTGCFILCAHLHAPSISDF